MHIWSKDLRSFICVDFWHLSLFKTRRNVGINKRVVKYKYKISLNIIFCEEEESFSFLLACKKSPLWRLFVALFGATPIEVAEAP